MTTDCKPRVAREDYARAERFLPNNTQKLMFGLNIRPVWIDGSDSFWYRLDTREGKVFKYVDPSNGEFKEAFDHAKVAAAISRTGKTVTHNTLPFDYFEYLDEKKAIRFLVDDELWKCDLATYELEKQETDEEFLRSTMGFGTRGRRQGRGRQRISGDEITSPDGKWVAFVKEHNIYVRSTESGEEIQLTFDGEEKNAYAVPMPSPIARAGLIPEWSRLAISWSPDSKRILTHKIDQRDVGECYLLQSVPLDGSKRPKVFSYVYPLPGDENVPKATSYILDVEQKTQVKIDLEPMQLLFYGGPYFWMYWTKGEKDRILMTRHERGFTKLRLYSVDPRTGAVQLLIEEANEKGVDSYDRRVVNNGEEIIWIAETDGWAHIYLYDGHTGALKNQVTSGPWVVRELIHVDEEERTIYFTAGGRERDRDPYYRHLYRVKMDGTDLQLLTPEDAEHRVNFSPTGNYFVDIYSRVDLPPETVLRDTSGRLIKHLESADVELLLATGWTFPEPFKAKARDGVTDIYGMIMRPSNFDPNKKYPVIEYNYSGPQTNITPKGFVGVFGQNQALAELGFIIVTIDGLGMNYRSKAFQDYSYKNLGDGGFPDHISAIKQLADRYPYMDVSRVGIYGGSAGGYASTKAILTHPDFYKVAVSWAGNHDHRTDKASWCERYMGFPVDKHYEEQANPTWAKNLKGKLLLMHGDMDENVPPPATLQLVDALIKANKDFDLLILPNGIHSSSGHPYITRKRWDYFVKHLLGAEPPKEYQIGNA